MSYSCDEQYRVYRENIRKSIKPHKCDACKEEIPRGSKYANIAAVSDYGVETIKRCARCQALHLHLREKCRTAVTTDTMWPDERLNCGETYEDEWGEVPEEIAALAFALPGEVSVIPERGSK